MSGTARSFAAALAVLWAPAHAARADQPLAPTEVAKLGKAATAFVEVKAGSGSAFCVHPSGLFVCSAHAVRDAGEGPVKVVVDAGLKTQRVFDARVARRDPALDLALLRADAGGPLPVLELGSDEDLTELTELVAFGFPFGSALAAGKGEYPAISVNVGRVTALRRDAARALARIQLDAVLNPGNSGGPVLDRRGKVVGVVYGGIPGAGVNLAVPVSHVRRFLARPDVKFAPPRLAAGELHRPATFEARAVPLLPGGKPLELDLLLSADGTEERRLPMAREGEAHRVTAAPVPGADGPPKVRLQATFPGGSVAGTVDDTDVQVGDQKVRLAKVRAIRFGPRPAVRLDDGKELAGQPAGLAGVRVGLGQAAVTVDLTQALEAKLEPPAPVDAVKYTIVVRQDGREVDRLTGALPVAGAGPGRSGGRDKTVLTLPSPVADVAIGGGGRYLILYLPRDRQLAVFDARHQKVVKHLAVPEDGVKFAAGADKLIVALPQQGVMLRYSLATLEREAVSSSLPFKGKVQAIGMGRAAAGPLLVYASEEGQGFRRPGVYCLDPDTFRETDARFDPQRGGGHVLSVEGPVEVRASPDGKVFAMWRPGVLPQGIQTLTVGAREVTAHYEHAGAGYLVPGSDGRTLFTAAGLYGLDPVRPVGDDPGGLGVLPAASGPFYVRFSQAGGNPAVQVALTGEGRPIAELTDIEGLARVKPAPANTFQPPPDPFGLPEADRSRFGPDKRFHFLPEDKLIVVIPPGNDRLVLYPFDVEEALERSGRDYLVVASHPPLVAKKGTTYSYQMKVRSRKGGLKYKLEAGPTGMAVSEAGAVSWEVPTGFVEAATNVIISVTAATGQERLQAFTLSVRP